MSQPDPHLPARSDAGTTIHLDEIWNIAEKTPEHDRRIRDLMRVARTPNDDPIRAESAPMNEITQDDLYTLADRTAERSPRLQSNGAGLWIETAEGIAEAELFTDGQAVTMTAWRGMMRDQVIAKDVPVVPSPSGVIAALSALPGPEPERRR